MYSYPDIQSCISPPWFFGLLSKEMWLCASQQGKFSLSTMASIFLKHVPEGQGPLLSIFSQEGLLDFL
jgi:hypothetical protein